MKSLLSFATLLIGSLLLSVTTHAEQPAPTLDDKSASAAAETFLADYIKSDTKNSEWVAKTKLATSEFKVAFKKTMASGEVDADPVLHAQDVPSTPFKAESSKVKGDTATVLVSAKYGKKPFKLQVTLIAKDGHWLVSKTTPVSLAGGR